jgi:hypothetical protein
VRVAAPELDVRLARGEAPSGDDALDCRSAQLVSKRSRRQLARGLERAWSAQPEHAVFSAAVWVNWRAVEIGRPALQQLAAALRSRESIQPRGAAIAHVLLTDGCSPLYRPTYREQLYEVAREALLALRPPGTGL